MDSKMKDRANVKALEKICSAEPTLVDVRQAIEVVPNMTPETILTSGPPMPWEDYTGGQRSAIIGGALFEGLAADAEEVDTKIHAGHIRLRPCHDHDCVGSITGVTTASMAVFVVENQQHGNRAFCTLFEGEMHERLTYGSYNEAVHKNILFLRDVVGRVISEAVRIGGGIPLRPIIHRALHMGDELHSRNTASTFLFSRELFPYLLRLTKRLPEEDINRTLQYLTENQYSFLRLSMASSKATANAAHNIEGSSIVTYQGFNCRNFAIKVSGLSNEWFSAPMPKMKAKFFEDYDENDLLYAGGESMMAETVGLGGLSSAAAFPLQDYVLATPEEMVERTLEMYKITLSEHPEFKIPYLRFRGIPVGIDIKRVVSTGITPVMDLGAAGKDGTQIGAGVFYPPLSCYKAALNAFVERYGQA